MTSARIALHGNELEQYHRAGYLIVRGRFHPDEVAAWQRECERLWSQVASLLETGRVQHRGILAGEKGSTIADRLDPVLDLSELFVALAHDERIVGLAGSALGTEAVLLKDKLITKRPGTMGYSMHQDFPYWVWLGIPPDELVTVQVAIDPADRENGAMELFPGLHHTRIQPPPDNPLDADETTMDLDAGEVTKLAAGDLLLFHSLVPHRSAPNRSTRSRRALFLTYCTARHPDAYRRYHSSRSSPVPS